MARLERTQAASVAGAHKPGILHVLHSRGGGTEKHVRQLVAQTRDRYRHYFMRILPDRWRFKDAMGEHGADCAWPRDVASEHCLRTMCAWLPVDMIHVHSFVGSADDLARMLEGAGVPWCCTIHDMYAACPTVYLADPRGDYCNATTDRAACARCLSQQPAFAGIDIAQWRARYGKVLRGARRVIAPSRWAGETIAKYYPGIDLRVAPHPVDRPGPVRRDVDAYSLPDDGSRHIGILGAVSPEKGARNIDTLAQRIRERRLPLRLVVIGYTDRARRRQSDDRVLTIHGSYGADELSALMDRYRIDLALFPTIWPETWSYTLSEAWQAGRPALVPPRGALMERVQRSGAGWIMQHWPSMDATADELCALTSEANVADLAERSRLAREAARAEVATGFTDPYAGLATHRAHAAVGPELRGEIEAAARRASGLP